MEKIGFFGGCFNPVTNIHINIAINLIKNKTVDKVIFIPVNDCYKKENLILAKHRYNMLKLSTKGYDNIEVDDIELKQNKTLFAVDIFDLIYKKYKNKNTELYMIMGSDNYNKMPKWKEYNLLKEKYNYIVIDRNKSDISSSEVRNMIKNDDKTVKDYLSDKVYEYIKKNNIYLI